MRLAVAATVLTHQSLSAASSSSSRWKNSLATYASSSRKREARRAADILSKRSGGGGRGGEGGAAPLGRFLVPAARAGRGDHGRSARLRNLLGSAAADHNNPPPHDNEFCDPHNNNNNNADEHDDVLGVLACGPGWYCAESDSGGSSIPPGPASGEDEVQGDNKGSNSNGDTPREQDPPATALGGKCVKDNTRPGMAAAGDVTHRQLQQDSSANNNVTNLIEFMAYQCYDYPPVGVSNDYNFSCDCQGVDEMAYSGISSCSIAVPLCTEYETFCGVENITQCLTFTRSLNVTGVEEYTTSTCTYYTSPETSSSCTGLTFNGPEDEYASSCSLSVEGVACNSCGFDKFDYLDDGNMISCLVFDCSNTVFGEVGSFCYGDLALQISSVWFEEELPCEGGCYVCGDEGEYTDFYANVTVPGLGDIPCYILDFYAVGGLDFGAEFCNSPNRSIIEEQCGCAVVGGGDGGDNLTSTTAPTGMPATKEDMSEPPVVGPETEGGGSAPSTTPPTGSTGGAAATPTSGASTTVMIKTTTGLMLGLAAAATAYAAAGMGLY